MLIMKLVHTSIHALWQGGWLFFLKLGKPIKNLRWDGDWFTYVAQEQRVSVALVAILVEESLST